MSHNFGAVNHGLTQAVRRIARGDSAKIRFTSHAEEEMDNDELDHEQVLDCLRNGTAFGPEIQNNRLRANVIHRGTSVRVSIGGLDQVNEDWKKLTSITVVTVMRN